MQITKTLLSALFLLGCLSSFSQSAYLPQGDKNTVLIDRMELLARNDSFFNFSKTRPFSRRHVTAAARHFEQQYNQLLSRVDRFNLERLYINNLEWLPAAERSRFASRKPIAKRFYTTPASMYEVHQKDFDLVVNPVIQYTVAKESDNDDHLFLNTRGVQVRGRIADKIGFFAYVTDNQERAPDYVQQFVATRKAVPGNGYYKPFKADGGTDYFDARGYFTFNVTRYIDVAFGYDKNFIGNGQRSLLLSDFSNNALFLKLNTRIWKFNYQNIFMELQQADDRIGDRLIGKKYAAMHHLDIQLNKWLNLGLFEGVVFGRSNRFDFGYLNPVIFYRSIEQQNGSFDNSIVGLDFKANLPKNIQVYGQLALDEFKLSEVRAGNGWWANKWGIQLGAKYYNAFGIPNLDLQVEHNRVRPFTYSHRDSVANYTHYNQPLAHPLMANFQEFLGVARYQPAPRWTIVGKLMAYQQGRDSSGRSYGSNIFLPNVPPIRQGDYGYEIGSGWKTNVFLGSLLLSYEWRENLFLELNALMRREKTVTAPVSSVNRSVISFGVRWNMHRRDFDF